jgi:hypothetical protein
MKDETLDEELLARVRARAGSEGLSCAEAFRIAEALGVRPAAVGRAADRAGVRLLRCQLGLFGYSPRKRIVTPAEGVSPELEAALREGLVLGRLPCAVAWALAARFGVPKLHIANAAEALDIRIADCQLGAF